MNWPSASDPFYLYNPVEVNARRSFYLVSYVPTLRYDGKTLGDPSNFGTYAQFYAFVRSTIDAALIDDSKFRIDLNQTREGDLVDVSFDVVAVGADIDADLNIYLVVNEDSAALGYYDFLFPFRDMVPGSSGEAVHMVTGDSLHFEWSYALPLHQEDIFTNILVQKPINKKIMQAARARIPSLSTGVAIDEVPVRIVLGRNAPNPFNPTTTIRFSLDRPREMRLSIFDSAGRLVRDLVHGESAAGPHAVTWNGTNQTGHDVGSGVYYYRLDAEETSLTQKMILIR